MTTENMEPNDSEHGSPGTRLRVREAPCGFAAGGGDVSPMNRLGGET
jgi:hypothetical protein